MGEINRITYNKYENEINWEPGRGSCIPKVGLLFIRNIKIKLMMFKIIKTKKLRIDMILKPLSFKKDITFLETFEI